MLLAAMLLLGTAAPAHAQLAGRVAIDSEYRNRGYAIADARPVASAAASYDHASGVYANAMVLAQVTGPDAGIAGVMASLGYAARVSRALSVEGGVSETRYARRGGGPLASRYTEVYAGVALHGVTARAYYSPNYFARDRHTLYGEVEASMRLAPKWNLNLHLGGLTYLTDPPRRTARSHYDWRASVSRSIGRLELYGALSGRGPGGDYYAREKGRAVATVGAAFAF